MEGVSTKKGMAYSSTTKKLDERTRKTAKVKVTHGSRFRFRQFGEEAGEYYEKWAKIHLLGTQYIFAKA